MRNWVVDGFGVKEWENIKASIRTGRFVEGDYYGAIKCGALCWDIVLRDCSYRNGKCVEWLLCADAYLLGRDTGYGYTRSGIPYDYADGLCLKFDISKGYEQTLCDFLTQIDEEVESTELWAEYADKTDLIWEIGTNDGQTEVDND